MRYPEFIKKNGTIGYVAPSFGAATEPYASAYKEALKNFKAEGYGQDLGPNVFAGEGIGISNTPAKCGFELTDRYCSKDNDVLISVGGGELMCEDLDYVDWSRLREAAPKWYMGYSDNTNFTFLLPTLCDTAAVYGPCAGSFGMTPRHEAVQDAWDIITGKALKDGKITVHGYDLWEKDDLSDAEHPLAPYNVTEPTEVRTYNWDGTPFSGRVIGGCMDILVNTLGTCYDRVPEFIERYRDDGIIWFMESCDLNVFSIRRAMWQMQHAGWFNHVKGFLIGRPYVYGQQMMGLDQYEAVLPYLTQYKVPIVLDCDLGHLPPMMPMISGGYGTVSPYGEKNIQIEFELK